jgi:hypothetical protein
MIQLATLPRALFLPAFLGLLVLVPGCAGTQTRGLKISEVGRRSVELYLDEPTTNAMNVGGSYKLSFRTGQGTTHAVLLEALNAPVTGGQFLMVWAQSGYQGPPVAEAFPSGQQGAVPGIKVPAGFFDDIDSQPCEVRLSGERNRVSGLLAIFPLFTKDVLDDVVRFGSPVGDRPESGGTFVSNGSLTNPSGSTSHQRLWSSGAPLDTNGEADWLSAVLTSWGVPTP